MVSTNHFLKCSKNIKKNIGDASDNNQGAKRSKRQGNFFPLTAHTRGVNILLALGSEVVRRPWFLCLETVLDPVLHDHCLASFTRIVHPSS